MNSGTVFTEQKREHFWKHLLLVSSYLPLVVGSYFIFRNEIPALILLLAGLPLIVFIFVYPFLGLLLCVFMMYSRIAGGLSLGQGFMVVVALTSFAWGMKWLIANRFSVQVPRKQIRSILGFLFFCLFSILFAVDKIAGIGSFLQLMKLLVFYLLVVNMVTTRKELICFVGTMLVAVSVSILSNPVWLYSVFSGEAFSLFLNRASGLGADPNVFAATVITVLPLPFFLFFHDTSAWGKLLWMSLFFMSCVGIVASLSRGAAVSLGVVLLLLLWIKRRSKLALFGAIVVVIAILLILPVEFWLRIGTLENLNIDKSLQWRLLLLKGGVSLFSEHPLTGVGLGNFKLFALKMIHLPKVAHNTILGVAAETGFFGVLFFLMLILSSFLNFHVAQRWFLERKDSTMLMVSQSLKIGFIGYLTAGLFLSLQFDFTLWTMFALSVIVLKCAREPNNDLKFYE